MLAKGNRSQQVTDACHKHSSFSLGSMGGPGGGTGAAEHQASGVHPYPELGMEAIWKIEVEDLPAFILVDDKGNDFSTKIVNNSRELSLRDLFGPAPGSMLPGNPPGPPLLRL
ncbi:fumarate hydratase C-terminal domain-containing protein [Shigella flexneri]